MFVQQCSKSWFWEIITKTVKRFISFTYGIIISKQMIFFWFFNWENCRILPSHSVTKFLLITLKSPKRANSYGVCVLHLNMKKAKIQKMLNMKMSIQYVNKRKCSILKKKKFKKALNANTRFSTIIIYFHSNYRKY